MRTTSGLILMAAGAILAFAVTSQPSFLNLHIVGWVLLLAGAAGLILPRRGYGWLRRRVVLREPGAPGAGVPPLRGRQRMLRRGHILSPVPPESRARAGQPATVTEVPGPQPPPRYPAEETVEETVEEFLEE